MKITAITTVPLPEPTSEQNRNMDDMGDMYYSPSSGATEEDEKLAEIREKFLARRREMEEARGDEV